MTPRAEFMDAVREQLPLTLGYAPIGLVCGAAGVAAGLSPLAVIAMSVLVFAGSSQLVASQLFAASAPGFVIVLSTAVVNVRMFLYAIAMEPEVKHLPTRWKLALAYFNVDHSYAVMMRRWALEKDHAHTHWYFLGVGVTLWVAWQFNVTLGALIGATLPKHWQLDFALALTFMAFLPPLLKSWREWLVAIVAGVAVVALAALPLKLGLLAAIALAVVTGVLLDRVAPVRDTEANA